MFRVSTFELALCFVCFCFWGFWDEVDDWIFLFLFRSDKGWLQPEVKCVNIFILPSKEHLKMCNINGCVDTCLIFKFLAHTNLGKLSICLSLDRRMGKLIRSKCVFFRMVVGGYAYSLFIPTNVFR